MRYLTSSRFSSGWATGDQTLPGLCKALEAPFAHISSQHSIHFSTLLPICSRRTTKKLSARAWHTDGRFPKPCRGDSSATDMTRPVVLTTVHRREIRGRSVADTVILPRPKSHLNHTKPIGSRRTTATLPLSPADITTICMIRAVPPSRFSQLLRANPRPINASLRSFPTRTA